MSRQQSLLDFICEELLEDEEPVSAEENLLADGMIDSLGMLRLVAFIEAEFEVKVPPQDFTIQNFRSVAVVDQYLDRLLGAG